MTLSSAAAAPCSPKRHHLKSSISPFHSKNHESDNTPSAVGVGCCCRLERSGDAKLDNELSRPACNPCRQKTRRRWQDPAPKNEFCPRLSADLPTIRGSSLWLCDSNVQPSGSGAHA